MAVAGLEELPPLWRTPERYFARHAQLYRAGEGVTAFPVPEYTGAWWDGEAPEMEMPTGVRRLVRHGRAHGWQVRVRYARGNRQHARTARPLGLAHSLAVALAHPGTSVLAVAVTFRPVPDGSWTWGSFLTSTHGALQAYGGYCQFTDHLAKINSDVSVPNGEARS